MKPRWALFRILRSFNQPGMERFCMRSFLEIQNIYQGEHGKISTLLEDKKMVAST